MMIFREVLVRRNVYPCLVYEAEFSCSIISSNFDYVIDSDLLAVSDSSCTSHAGCIESYIMLRPIYTSVVSLNMIITSGRLKSTITIT